MLIMRMHLRIAGKKHDVIGIKIYDKMDMELPNAGPAAGTGCRIR
jgi:hypothetical protein